MKDDALAAAGVIVTALTSSRALLPVARLRGQSSSKDYLGGPRMFSTAFHADGATVVPSPAAGLSRVGGNAGADTRVAWVPPGPRPWLHEKQRSASSTGRPARHHRRVARRSTPSRPPVLWPHDDLEDPSLNSTCVRPGSR